MTDPVEWHVDDRRARWWTRAYLVGMRVRRDDHAFDGAHHTRSGARQRQRAGDRPPTWLTRLVCRIDAEQVNGMTVWRARRRGARPRARVLYLHGGGYVHPLTADYWRLVRALAGAPAEVVVPGYPLAPDHTAAEVVPRLAQLLREVSGSLPTVVMGDSAGGALAIVLARELRDAAGPSPAGVVALCPWLDPLLADDEVAELEPTDPVLDESGLRAAAQWWAGSLEIDDPRIDVLNDELSGLPPLDIWIGDRDILRPAVDRLASRARAEGAALAVHEVTAMFHVWMTRAVPEARRTRRQLVQLVRRRAGLSS